MEIYLVRHTTPNIEKGVCYGQANVDLSSSFRQEAEEVIKKLPTDFDVVYSSPLKRCTQLADLFTQDYEIDSRLKELNFGDWELERWDNIPQTEIQPWYDDWVNYPPTNGESYQELSDRVSQFLNHLLLLKTKKTVIISHAGPIRALVAHVKGIKLRDSFEKIKVNYGEVIRL